MGKAPKCVWRGWGTAVSSFPGSGRSGEGKPSLDCLSPKTGNQKNRLGLTVIRHPSSIALPLPLITHVSAWHAQARADTGLPNALIALRWRVMMFENTKRTKPECSHTDGWETTKSACSRAVLTSMGQLMLWHALTQLSNLGGRFSQGFEAMNGARWTGGEHTDQQ